MSVDETPGVTSEETPASDGVADTPSDAEGDPMIAVRNLAVSFGDLDVLADVDVTVDRGTFVGLVGPNGAGKTTLLRTVKGTLEPDSGEVRLAGDAVADLTARERGRRVASVPQDTSLSFDFPVRTVVEMGRTPHLSRFGGHDADDAEAVRRAMERADVAKFADRSIRTVSGGERQRVLLARALAQETPALLLDEPTASLDVNHAVRTLELVRRLVDDGKTAVAAIHDLDMAARYCDKLVLVADGAVQAAGPPRNVLTAGALRNAFDAETFVGDDPVTGAPSVTTLPTTDYDPHRVHVVGTGPDAARVIGRLAAAGHDLSVGVAPEGDVAERAAVDAGAPVVTVAPFSAIGEEASTQAAELSATADVTVVVGTPATGNEVVVDHAQCVVDVSADADAASVLDAISDAMGAPA
ncbi:heme ABC transporter ATP-binding protein [Halorubrum gandharaense]